MSYSPRELKEEDIQGICDKAGVLAISNKHEYMTVEHILSVMLESDDTVDLLSTLGANVDEIKQNVTDFLDSLEKVEKSAYMPEDMPQSDEPGKSLKVTEGVQKFYQSIIVRALSRGTNSVECHDIILSIVEDEDDESFASYFLRNQDITSIRIKEYVSHGVVSAPGAGDTDNSEAPGAGERPKRGEMPLEHAHQIIGEFCVNLNEVAENGNIDPLIGRESEVEDIVHVVARRKKNNVIMVGEPGVGKTAIVEGLAKKIIEDDVPNIIKGSTVYQLDVPSIVAGTQFRGAFEERMKFLLKAFEIIDTKPILFIDEIHNIMGAGGGGRGDMDVANLLKPSLARGYLQCIGTTTYDEYRTKFERDRALVRRFQRTDISEPSVENSKRILHGLKAHYEDHHNVRYSDGAIDSAVELTSRYVTNRFLPDKAIDVIDAAGAWKRINETPTKNGKPRKTARSRRVWVKDTDIEREVSKIAKIPEKTVGEDDKQKLSHLLEDLSSKVFCQEVALESLVASVYESRAGLREKEKPQGIYLFTGPTGVGKTETARQLASTLGVTLHRFDMSEFMERHSVSKLIGAPPGYVGYEDESGQLIDALDTDPYSIILLDEIEKAHPDVFNILLQVMDNGEITNSKGKTVSARNAYILMTCNAGAAEMDRQEIGFGRGLVNDADDDALKDIFPPEFRNRLDSVVKFNRLSTDAMLKVVEKFLKQLSDMAAEKNVTITASPNAKKWLAEKGYNPSFGARPLARVISEHIKRPMSKEMVVGALADGGGKVLVDTSEDGGLDIEFRT